MKLPESARIEGGNEINVQPREARLAFYELAREKIKYVDTAGMVNWHNEVHDRKYYPANASYIISRKREIAPEGETIRKWIDGLEIVINEEMFIVDGIDYSDLIPFAIEHEIYEAWLSAKRGTGSMIDVEKKHLLAVRREYLLAEEQDLGDKLLKYDMSINPGDKDIYSSALELARRILKKI